MKIKKCYTIESDQDNYSLSELEELREQLDTVVKGERADQGLDYIALEVLYHGSQEENEKLKAKINEQQEEFQKCFDVLKSTVIYYDTKSEDRVFLDDSEKQALSYLESIAGKDWDK